MSKILTKNHEENLHGFMKLIIYLFLVQVLFVSVQAQNRSFYSDLIISDCEILESKSKGDSRFVAECNGFGDFKLQVIDSFLRGSINVISPSGKKTELNLWNHFSELTTVEGKVEWRYKENKKPVSVIIPYSVQYPQENGSMKTMNYSFVIKLSDESVCITDIVKPSKNQKSVARGLADKALKTPCMKDPILDD